MAVGLTACRRLVSSPHADRGAWAYTIGCAMKATLFMMASLLPFGFAQDESVLNDSARDLADFPSLESLADVPYPPAETVAPKDVEKDAKGSHTLKTRLASTTTDFLRVLDRFKGPYAVFPALSLEDSKDPGALGARVDDKGHSFLRVIVHNTQSRGPGSRVKHEVEWLNVQKSDVKASTYKSYHFGIDWNGGIHPGADLAKKGAHAGKSRNVGSIGIALLGDFRSDAEVKEDVRVGGKEEKPIQPLESARKPTPEQLDSLARLIAALSKHYARGEGGLLQVLGHRDVKSTTCPGDAVGSRLDHVRKQAFAHFQLIR